MATAHFNPYLRLVEYQAKDRVARTERVDDGWHVWLYEEAEAREVRLRTWAPTALKARQLCREWVEGRRQTLGQRKGRRA